MSSDVYNDFVKKKKIRKTPVLAIVWRHNLIKICCCSVTQACPTLCDPMDCGLPGFPVLHYILDLLKLMAIKLSPGSSYQDLGEA